MSVVIKFVAPFMRRKRTDFVFVQGLCPEKAEGTRPLLDVGCEFLRVVSGEIRSQYRKTR
jgi:hypothetical protein